MSEALQKPTIEKHLSADTDPSFKRALEVELALDPEHTLPEVTLIRDPSKLAPKRGQRIIEPDLITHDGEVIGECVITWDKSNNERYFHGITIYESHRGKGFGLATYKEVIEQAMIDGCRFKTEDWSQTESAKKIWDLLHAKGLAEVVSEFIPDGEGRYAGEYVINPS